MDEFCVSEWECNLYKKVDSGKESNAGNLKAVNGRCLRNLEIGSGFEEGLEDGLWVVEVVVHDVDEERCFHELTDELARGCLRIV